MRAPYVFEVEGLYRSYAEALKDSVFRVLVQFETIDATGSSRGASRS
jgi:hypothetical protein